MLKIFLASLMALLTLYSPVQGQELVLYKTVDSTGLYLQVLYPPGFDTGERFPAMVFFFGGGWVGGDRSQFFAPGGVLFQTWDGVFSCGLSHEAE